MRLLALVSVALFVATATQAQTWAEWPNREDRFVVNFPGEPMKTDLQYKTAKGTVLPAHVYSAEGDPKSRSAGTYSVTVVDYSSAPDEVPAAIADAAKVARTKGIVKYDEENNVDQMRSQRVTVETADKRRILSEILVSAEKRLYIVEANTPINVPPPAQFQASVQILDADGTRIRYRTVGSSERVR
jgi:hypothetical protein